MEVQTSSTITDTDENEWKTLTGTDHVERSYAWYRALEESDMVDMRYIFLREKNLEAACCAFPFIERLYIRVPFMEVRSPLGSSTSFFSKCPAHTELLVRKLEEIRAREKGKGILITELNKEEHDFLKNTLRRFTSFPIHDTTYLDLHFTDFDDYLSSLEAEDRRSVRKTLNRAEKRWGIHALFTSEFSQWAHVAHDLQKYVIELHSDYRRHLTLQFYRALERYLKENAELVLLFKDSIPIASGLLLNTDTISRHTAAGINPRYRECHAYFLLYYEGIKRAIEKKQKRICFGPTTYEFKEKIGCKREPVFGLVKMDSPLLDIALKSYIAGCKVLDKRF